MSNDIVRGLRWGAIIMTGCGVVLMCYRILSAPVAARTPAAKIAAPSSPKPSSSAPGESRPPAPSPAKSRDVPVPPPPPIGFKVTHGGPAGSSPDAKTERTEAGGKDEEEIAVVEEASDAASAESSDDKDAEESAKEKIESEESGGAIALEENAAKNDGRGKRMLKAVGRFLRLGPRPYQAVRDKN